MLDLIFLASSDVENTVEVNMKAAEVNMEAVEAKKEAIFQNWFFM